MKKRGYGPLAFGLRQAYALFPFLVPLWNSLNRLHGVRGSVAYVRDLRRYAAQPQDPQFPLRALETIPFVYDRYAEAGQLPRHYFHQDLWAARKVYASRVARHYDFGSRIDGFVAHCLTFCEVTLLDIRPFPHEVPGLRAEIADITDLRAIPADSIASLSSLHAIEHVGLGRYGDPIDPFGYRKALAELERVTAPGGSLYLSVPIGWQRLEFNGHRVFAPATIPALMTRCDLAEFAAIDDDDRLVLDADPERFADARYACGLYHFVKRPARSE